MRLSNETIPAEEMLAKLEGWARRTPWVQALWTSGSFATGTADRLSDVNLAGAASAPAPEVFASFRNAVGGIHDDDVVIESASPFEGEPNRIMILWRWGLAVDFHFVSLPHLSAGFVGPWPIRVLFERDCAILPLHERAHAMVGEGTPAALELQIRQAMRVWNHIRGGVVAWARADHLHAQSCLELARIAFSQMVAGRRRVRPGATDGVYVPRFLTDEEKAFLGRTIPRVVQEAQPTSLKNIMDALRQWSHPLEDQDATGRLPRFRRIIEALVEREFPPSM